GSRPGGPPPAGRSGAGRLVPLLGGSCQPRRYPPRPTHPRPRLRRADGLRGRISPVRTPSYRRWEDVRAPPSRAYAVVPGPVPAARAGECLLILFPRTGTGTVFILENRAGVSSTPKGGDKASAGSRARPVFLRPLGFSPSSIEIDDPLRRRGSVCGTGVFPKHRKAPQKKRLRFAEPALGGQ